MNAKIISCALVSLLGCVAEPIDSTSPSSGGGKADDVACSTDTYRTWLIDQFLPAARALPRTAEGVERARAAAAASPCTEAHDDAYGLWLAIYQQELAPVTMAFDAALAACETSCTQANYDAFVAAGPSDATARWLDILATAKPVGGLKGQAAWNALYAPFVSRAARPILTQAQILEPMFTFDTAEAALHAALAAAAPGSTAPKSTALWLGVDDPSLPGVYLPLFERATSSSGDGGKSLTAAEMSFLADVALTQPASRAELDYTTWFGAYAPRIATSFPAFDDSERGQLDELEGVRPEAAGGAAAYGAFLQTFVDRVMPIVGDSSPAPTSEELAVIDRLVAVKPCGTSIELEAAYGRVATAYASIATLSTRIAAIAPSACEP